MKKSKQQLTLDRPAKYMIRVPGEVNAGWSIGDGAMAATFHRDEGDRPITTLTGTFDQAALLGLLRRLYALGVPLISVECVDLG
jgi:hypothetical protein